MHVTGRRMGRVVLLILVVAIAGCAGRAEGDRNLCSEVHGAEDCNVVQGYGGNGLAAGVAAATIAGGGQKDWPHRVTATGGTVGGGVANVAGTMATVSGGSHNTADFFQATVGGGARNVAAGNSATVAGGYDNAASGDEATVGGGQLNEATTLNATVAGGAGNAAAGHHATVGGGTQNRATGVASTIGGGVGNLASAEWASVGGGLTNQATGLESAVGGGAGNRAAAYAATAAGGLNNQALGAFSTICGGRSNVAGDPIADPDAAAYSMVGGGTENLASGAFSTVPGGDGNVAGAAHSLAAGHRARVDPAHTGSFLYADATDADFASAAANEFAVRAGGGVRLVTAVDAAGTPTAGVRLPAGSGSWEMLSDRAAKVAFAEVDSQQILSQVAALPLSTWSYASEAQPARHLGPTAQDFRAAFGLGSGDTSISAVDADGVALASIQRLSQLVQEQDRRITELEGRVSSQEQRLAEIEAQLPASCGQAQAPLLATAAWCLAGGFGALGLALLAGIALLAYKAANKRLPVGEK